MGYKVKLNNQEVEDQIMNNFESLGFEIVLPKDDENKEETTQDDKKDSDESID